MPILRDLSQLAALVVILAGPVPLIASVLPPRRGWACWALTFLVLWCAVQTTVGAALGWSHLLRLPFLLALETALLLGGIVLLRRQRGGEISPAAPHPSPSDGKSRGLDNGPPASLLPRLFPSSLDPAELAVVGVIAAFGLYAAWTCASTPTTNYDSWAYHLPVIANWHASRYLAMIDPGDPVYRFPMDWELLCALMTFPFRDDFLTTLPNLAAWSILGLSVFLLARRLDATRLSALTATSLLLLSPQIARMLNSNQVDVALAAFVLAAVFFTLDARDLRDHRSFFLALICWSMALGVKLTGGVYLLALSAVLAMGEGGMIPWKDSGRTSAGSTETRPGGIPHRRQGDRRAWIAVAVALVLSVPWYLRNLLQVGNPLGFIQVKILGMTLLPGTLSSSYLKSTALLEVFDFHRLQDYLLFGTILRQEIGVLFLAAGALSLLAVPWVVLRHRRRPVVTLLALCAVAFLIYVLTPASGSLEIRGLRLSGWTAQELRFGFVWLALLAVWVGLAGRRIRPALLVVVSAAAPAFTGYPLDDPAQIAAFAVVFLPLAIRRFRPGRGLLRTTASRVILLLIAAGLASVAHERRRDLRSSTYGDDYDFLQSVLQPDDVIAYTATRQPYILLGGDFRHRLVFASAREVPVGTSLRWAREHDVTIFAIGPAPRTLPGVPPVRRPILRELKTGALARHLRLLGGTPGKGFVFYRVTPSVPGPPTSSTSTSRTFR